MSLPHISQRIRKALTSPWRPLIRGGRSATWREPGYLLLGMSSFLQRMDTSHQSPSCHLSKQHPGLCWLRMAPEHCCRVALRGQIGRKSLHGPSGGGQPPQPGVPCPQKGSRSWLGAFSPTSTRKRAWLCGCLVGLLAALPSRLEVSPCPPAGAMLEL